MYNKFAKGDLIKITNPAITYPVSANIEMWDNNELRTFENLNRPMRNLFENNQELYSIIKNLQNGLKMGGSSILNGCELVVSEAFDEKRYVSLTPGLFFYDDVSYSIYPTPSIASRQLEEDLGIYTEDGINYINITYENGKFNADINISADLSHPTDTVETIPNIDRGIDLLAEIKEKLTTAGFTVSKDLHEYTLEPCFEITSGKKFVNFNETTGAINLENLTATLSFGFVDNFNPTNNESANWEGLTKSAYKDDSVTNAKLDDMAKDTLKGNNTAPGDPKDLGKAEVVAMFDLVTRDTPQTIDETKTFTENQIISNTKKLIFKNQTGETGWNISNSDDNTLLLKEGEIERISIAKDNGAMIIANPISLSETLGVTGATTLANSLTVNASDAGEKIDLNGATTITGDTAMTGKLTVKATATGKSIDFSGPTTITGNFTVDAKASGKPVLIEGNTKIKSLDNGTIELETPALSTTSKKFVIGSGSTNNITTDGSGIVFKSYTDKTFLWENGTPEASSFTSSENLNLVAGKTYKINKIDVLSSDTLGAEIVNSSLTKVGTIASGIWNGTPIAVDNGGTGATSYTNGELLIGNTTGNTLTKGTISGTANRITVTNGNGTITLNTPQDIHTGASPTFVGLTLTGNLAVNGSAITTTKTTGFSILDTKLTGTLSIAKLAETITMGEVANITIGKTANTDKTFTVANTTTSTNSTSGALVVSGGVGIGGNVYTNGTLTTAGKITSVGLQSTVTGASLKVATNGVNTTGNVKSIISSTEKFSIEKDGTGGNLLSVEHDDITVDVGIVSSKAITSSKKIKASDFETTSINTVSAINSQKFNGNTIKNIVDPTTSGSVTLLWTDSTGTGTEIKRTLFTEFPVAHFEGTTAKNGLMPATALTRIDRIEKLAGIETSGDNFSLVRTVNGETADATSGNVVVYGSLININKETYVGSDGKDERTTSISGAIRELITEKERVKGHLPLKNITQSSVGQIIKKTKGGTDVVWGQITDDEIESTLTKVSPSSKKGITTNTTGTIHKVAFWNNNEESLLSHNDITYDISSNTLIAETVSSRSSRKLKKDIELYEKSAFDTIDKIDIVSYHFIADETQTDRVGFIAEDSPELVSGKDRDHMEMNNCIGLLLKAVQELKEENQELRKLINDRNS